MVEDFKTYTSNPNSSTACLISPLGYFTDISNPACSQLNFLFLLTNQSSILVNDSLIFLLFKPKTQASSLILYLLSLDAQSLTGPTCLTPNSISEPSCSPHLDHARPAAITSYLVWSGSFSTSFPASTSALLPIHPPCSHLSSFLNR